MIASSGGSILQPKEVRRAAKRAGQKIEILENDQESHVAKQAYSQVQTPPRGLLRFFDLQAGDIVDHRDGPDHKDVARAPAHVEVVAGDEQNDFAGGAARDQEKQPHHDKK